MLKLVYRKISEIHQVLARKPETDSTTGSYQLYMGVCRTKKQSIYSSKQSKLLQQINPVNS